ncbi:MAG TPA: hypothetical protein VMY35_18905, partial [Phycisphaerae bacterium]|nr:hypothetical protein [Phycisphaerae bacterium]
ASPPRIAVGSIYLIADGTIQTSGASIAVRAEGGAEAGGGGTTAYGASGTIYYTPTQAETNYTAFCVTAYKASCTSASVTVVTTATAVSGKVDVGAVDGNAQRATDLAEIAQYLIANSAEPITTYVADESLLAKMLAADGDISAYDDTTDSQEAIGVEVAKIGTIPALDGAAQTIGAAIAKIADDNGGATFDATTDSLAELQTAVAAGFPENNTADAEPGGGAVVTGTNTSGDGDSTFLNDGTYWQVAGAAADGDGFGVRVDQTFTLGITKKPSFLAVNANETLVGVVHVWAYNYLTTSWDQLSDSATAISGSVDNDYTYPLLPAHQQAGDGEVQIRYTSTDTTTNKYLYLDQVLIQTVTSGPTLNEIAGAVWSYILGNPDESTAAYALHRTRALVAYVASGDTATSFTLTAGVAVNDAYNGMLIMVEDETDDHYEVRRITDYTSGRVVTVDRAFGFTPATGDHVYIMATGYADVNTTAISDDSTAADNLESILDGTGGTGLKLSTLEVTGTTTLTGNVGLGGTLGVTGATTLASLVVSGTTALTGAVTMPAGLTTDITGNLSGSVGSVTTKTGYSLVSTGLDLVTAWTVDITGAVSGNSTHDAAGVKTAIEADGSKIDHLWEMTEDDGGTRRLTENALEEAPSGGTGLTADETRTALGMASANLDTQLADIPTVAEFEARTLVAASYFDASTDEVTTDAASRTASKADVSALATAAALADGTIVVGTINDGAVSAAVVADIFSTTALTESYAADAAAGTPAQLLYLILQGISEFAISSTTKTVKKLDGSTTAATYTLDDETSPTSITRAT